MVWPLGRLLALRCCAVPKPMGAQSISRYCICKKVQIGEQIGE